MWDASEPVPADATICVSRLEERLEYLEGLKEDLQDAEEALENYLEEKDEDEGEPDEEAEKEFRSAVASAAELFRDEEANELEDLRALAREFGGIFPRHETLISDDEFPRYAEELASDFDEGTNLNVWPMNCIDWEKAAKDLQVDYSAVEYQGVTYWVRS